MRSARWHLGWFTVIATLAFLVPVIGTTVLELQHDLYLLIYFTITLAVLGVYATRAGVDVGARLRRYWPASLALGALLAVFVVRNLLDGASTPHPDGVYFAFELVWRGVIYGIVDATLLSAFPALVAFALVRSDVHGIGRKLVFGAGTLVLSAVITATYHLGYEQFQNDRVATPVGGNVAMSIPAIITTNPIGSLAVHPTMHVAAIIHEYEGDTYLPPATPGYEQRFAGTAAWALAVGWAAMASVALTLLRRRARRAPLTETQAPTPRAGPRRADEPTTARIS